MPRRREVWSPKDIQSGPNIRTEVAELRATLARQAAEIATMKQQIAEIVAAAAAAADRERRAAFATAKVRQASRDVGEGLSEHDYEPIEVYASDVRAWAMRHGMDFRGWDDLPAVNRLRERDGLRTFKRKFAPTRGSADGQAAGIPG
jgi:hypothetical protein